MARGAADGDLGLAAADPQLDQVVEFLVRGAEALLDRPAAGLGDARGVDEVHVLLADGAQQAADGERLEGRDVVLGDLTEEGEVDGRELAAEELGRDRAQHLGDGDVGPDDFESLGGYEGGVDGVAGRAPREHVEHLLGDVDGDALLGLDGRAGEVGGDDDALVLEEGVLGRGAPR